MLNLIITNAPDKGRVFELTEDRTHLIGRVGGAITLPDRSVSRIHAELTPQNGRWYINDAGSTNGTFVNGRRLASPTAMRDGDQIRVGRTVFVVDLVGRLAGGKPGLDRPTVCEETQKLTSCLCDDCTSKSDAVVRQATPKTPVKTRGAVTETVVGRSVLAFSWSVLMMLSVVAGLVLADAYT